MLLSDQSDVIRLKNYFIRIVDTLNQHPNHLNLMRMLMATVPISMRKLKDVIRLKFDAKLSNRQVAASLSISAATVSNYINRAIQLGITSWPLDAKWDEHTLTRAFNNTPIQRARSVTPDWVKVQQELRCKTMTLQLLWEEYQDQNPKQSYSYNHYCRLYRHWLGKQKLSMRQNHKAGEKLFVDYCGKTIDIINPDTGEIRTAQVFVAAMGASNYTYAEATWSQGLEDWIMSHARCLEFLGGVPELIVPDNLKSGVSKSCRYEPDLNPTYQQLAAYYQTTVIPARPYKPQDKSKVEVAVQIVERWIMARLRHTTFYSLKQLNQHITELLHDLNNRPMKKHPGTRASQFEAIDQGALKPLPKIAYQYTQIKKVRVHLDYHVEVNKHYYSVPHALVKQQLEVHITGQQVHIYQQDKLVAQHPRSHCAGRHTTNEQHMPTAHRAHNQWTPERFERWAKQIGADTQALVALYLSQRRHVEQNYRRCLGLLNLAKTYTEPRLNAACKRALMLNTTTLKSIEKMLEKGLESQPLPSTQAEQSPTIHHQNLRGQNYYQH